MKRKCVLFFFLFCLNCCFAQEPFFRHFGVEQGLPSSEVYDILQDRNGFIWIATDRGVSKYDGYSFRNFSSSDGLTDNTVFILTEDTSGRIWCGTLNSKLCYFTSDRIFPYAHNSILENQSQSNYIMQSMNITSSGDVLVGYQRNGCLQINSTGEFFNFASSKKNKSHVYEAYASDNYFIFGSTVNSALLNADKNQLLYVEVNGQQLQIVFHEDHLGYYVTGLRKKDKTLLIAAGNTIVEIFPGGGHRIHKFDAQILRMNEDDAANSWISLNGKGVRQYMNGADLSGTNFTTFLPNETVTDVMQDNESGYWLSTLGHGVFYLVSARVHCLFPMVGTGEASVSAIASKPNGEILLGTSNGYLHTCTQGQIRSAANCNSTSENSDFIQDIYVSPEENDVWICTNKAVLQTSSGGNTTCFIVGGFARAIGGDAFGGCWIGGTNRLMHFRKNEQEPDQNLTPDCRIEEVFWDSITDKLLVGRSDGLYWLDGNELERFGLSGGELTSRVSAIRRVSNSRLVVGTIGSGICVIDNDRQSMINTKQGLCSSIINDIDVDKNGDVWAATNAGVAQIHWTMDTVTVHCFSIFHGLPTNEIRKILCNNDTIWIGTNSGAAWFIPGELEHTSVAPPIFIQEILVNGEPIDSVAGGDFPYDQNDVRFSFLGISFRNGGNTTYRYRLAGNENDWTYTSNRSVEYASLPPGDYRFEVMAKNGDGTWSNSAAAFGFVIRQPIWYTWWFWTILVVLFTGTVWWNVRKWLNNIRKNALQKRLMGEYQHQALAAQMNPHFIFNSLSSMQAFVLGDEKENALRYIDRFSFLMRKSLEYSMLKFVTLEKEIELLRAYLDIEAMRFGDKLAYTITCDDSLEAVRNEVPTMLVQPFAENAVRHGLLHRDESGGKISIDFTWKDNAIWCCVEDNGVGRKRSAEINRSRKRHISFGSSITEERLHLLCDVTGQLYSITYTDKTSEDGSSAGTIVYFMLPSRKWKQHVEGSAH